jgi:hypothetical protein
LAPARAKGSSFCFLLQLNHLGWRGLVEGRRNVLFVCCCFPPWPGTRLCSGGHCLGSQEISPEAPCVVFSGMGVISLSACIAHPPFLCLPPSLCALSWLSCFCLSSSIALLSTDHMLDPPWTEHWGHRDGAGQGFALQVLIFQHQKYCILYSLIPNFLLGSFQPCSLGSTTLI